MNDNESAGSTQARRRTGHKTPKVTQNKNNIETHNATDATGKFDSHSIGLWHVYTDVSKKDLPTCTPQQGCPSPQQTNILFDSPREYVPLSPGYTEISDTHAKRLLDGIPLSYILHPSHETNITIPGDEEGEDPSTSETSTVAPTNICAALNIDRETFRRLYVCFPVTQTNH